jgi:hypothetical protein
MKKSELKNLLVESIVEELNNEITAENMNTDTEFHRGFQAGLKARVYGGKAEMDKDTLKGHYPPAFIKGYQKALYGSWWDRFNNKLTDFAGRMGYSRTGMR